MSIQKIGRNDPCPCGSGKKYKKCCLLVEQNKEIEELKSIDKFPLYEVLITEPRGSRAIVISRKCSNGNIAFISLLVDEWKIGLKDCYGSYNIPRKIFWDKIGFDRLPFVDANLDECKKLIKRGMLIAKQVGTRIPEEFEKFKPIIGNLDDVSVTGSLYKCFECGEGDLSDEEIELIKKVTKKDMERGVCGKPGETILYIVCDECKGE